MATLLVRNAAVPGRSDIGALAPRMCADFFALRLDDVAFAGGLADPVVATHNTHAARLAALSGGA
ncbi:hypothetical protein ACFSKM_24290 [Ancylobacter dichloromethanicus]|uniref:Uncharacterized protein n=1 Tax=Ancylobacter dichloromethanicus TaxID=518825 RepID=A0A9W6JA36_9HYPH|nr:hypothetical protein [Ancylobacter dichloromethanicus]GLK71858.1 hypothetical protein GCM10017643_19740 [Ancylobacter dichloromethanicus]